MSTAEAGRRVALLARPGAARDCVRAALLDAGVELVAEEDPAQADPDVIRGVTPQVLMIVLDAASEEALGRFDGVIGDPAIEVMFEEADVALSREGWEAARWRRHLAAKLHRSDDVLPPVAAGEAEAAADALSLHIEELIAVDEAGAEIAPVIDVPPEAAGGEGFQVFDTLAGRDDGPAQDMVLGIEGLEFDATAFDATAFDPAAFDPVAFDANSLDTASFDADPLPAVTGPDFSASDFDPLLAELDAELPEATSSLPGTPDWNGDAIDGSVHAGAAANVSEDPDAPSPAEPPPLPRGFGELSLADDAALVAVPATGRGAHDLEELERRISSLQLVDDTPPAEGVVLVIAGMGGPDAVRQFLGGLPATFPRAVLVRQRLDGARYDKLVAQMQRATELPVALAEVGRPVAAGTVYVVGDELGLDAASGLRFAPGDRLLESLPLPGSAVVLLSGSDPADVEPVAALASRGAWLGAQARDGCYDPVAAEALAARGAASDAPAELARQLARRWST